MTQTSRPTKDSRGARIKVYVEVFGLVQSRTQQTLQWGGMANGRVISSPDDFYDLCYQAEFDRSLKCMEEPEAEIDRHKIIAITQKAVLDFLPIRRLENSQAAAIDDDTFKLNVKFAFYFGLGYLCRWNEFYYPRNNFVNSSNPFNRDWFLLPLTKTDAGKCFMREHAKLLCADHKQSFPVFYVANIWFLIEQWGLTYARHQKGWPQER